MTVPTEPFPPVRRLGPGDLRRCAALAVDREWAPEEAKWALLLAASEAFGVDAPDGAGLAGAVVLTRWAADYAAVGMMLVAARYERRGLGRALMGHLLRAAGDGATVTLFATDMGRPLYEKFGFTPVRRSVSFTGRFRPAPKQDNSKKHGALVRPATEADLPAVLALDRAAFGADRGPILTRLCDLADQVVVLEADGAAGPGPGRDGPGTAGPGTAGTAGTAGRAGRGFAGTGIAGTGIAGYAAAWRNNPDSTVIGPLVAPDGVAARRLVATLAARAGTPVRLDLDPDRPELPGWADARGLEPARRTVVMARGPLTPRGIPGHLYTPISVALA